MINLEFLKAICGFIAIVIIIALIIGAAVFVFVLLNNAETEDDEHEPIDKTHYEDSEIYR